MIFNMVTSKHAKIEKISFKNTEKVAHINFSDKLELEDIMMTPCNGKGIQLTYIRLVLVDSYYNHC